MSNLYKYLVRAITDTLKASPNTTAVEEVNIPDRIEGVENITLQSSPGDWTNSKIQFPVSPNANAYKYYRGEFGANVDMHNPLTVTQSTVSGIRKVTLPTLSTNGTGKCLVVVVALLNGVEDGTRPTIEIEYAAGVIVQPRPNSPQFSLSSKNGRVLTLNWSYFRAREKSEATGVEMYLVADGDSLGSTPDGEAAMEVGGIIRSATVQGTAGSDGWYWACVRATDGATLSENVTLIGPFWLSEVEPDAPDNINSGLLA